MVTMSFASVCRFSLALVITNAFNAIRPSPVVRHTSGYGRSNGVVVSLSSEDMATELGFELARTVIAWGVPLGLTFVAASGLFRGGMKEARMERELDLEYEFGLDDEMTSFGPKPPPGFPPFLRQRPRNRAVSPSYLKIERLNARLESFAYDLTKAAEGRNAARKQRRRARLRTAFQDELGALDTLSEDQLDAIAKAEREYAKASGAAKKAAARTKAALRAEAFARGEGSGVEFHADSDDDDDDVDMEEPGSWLDIFKDMTMGNGSSNLTKYERQYANAARAQARAEATFLREVAGAVPDPKIRGRVERVVRAARGELDDNPVDALREALDSNNTTSLRAPRVYALEFVGDIEANQVVQLREEVTAVLDFANPTHDEVVLKLRTGGGTVTGYGLAAAQLLRLKDAGVKLTIGVEQVAASGGYMMACCADHLAASPFAVLGSIGVIADVPNVYERLLREGIEFQTVTAGKYKRTITPTKKVTREDIIKQKSDLEDVLKLFKTFVKQQRPTLDIDKVATGETWFGKDALDMGLCDELKAFDDIVLEKFQLGAQVFSVKYREPRMQQDLAQLLTTSTSSDQSLVRFVADILLRFLSRLVDDPSFDQFRRDQTIPGIRGDIAARGARQDTDSIYMLDPTPQPRFQQP